MEETPNTLTHTQCYQQSPHGHRLLWAWDPTYTLTHAHCYQHHPTDIAFCRPGIHPLYTLTHTHCYQDHPVDTALSGLACPLWPRVPSLASAEDSRVPHAAPLQAPTSLWRFHPPRQGQAPRSDSDGPRILHLSPSQPQGDTQHDCPSPSLSPACGGGAPPVRGSSLRMPSTQRVPGKCTVLDECL